MNLTEFVMLALFVMAFVIVPVIFIQSGSRRRSTTIVQLQECPHCGAQNYKTKERCYCCGVVITSPRVDETGPSLLRRVKQADEVRPPQSVANVSGVITR